MSLFKLERGRLELENAGESTWDFTLGILDIMPSSTGMEASLLSHG